ncbi:MAG: chloride channel protein [Bacteroidales bacterium]|nr:chloride channel protein [Bacteroidales bacterium]
MTKKKKNHRLFRRFLAWRYRHMSEYAFLLVLSVLVGLLGGVAAVALKTVVHFINKWLLGFNLPSFLGGNLLVLFYPALGIFLTLLFVRYVAKGNIGHGLPTVLYSISRQQSILPQKNMFTSLVASTLTVAFGGSVGLEAPIASTGSAIGSNIARFFRLGTQSTRMLLGCGAAGALAGIFQAPVAGVMFVVEIFLFDLTMRSSIPLLLSTLSATSMAYFFMGKEVLFYIDTVEAYALDQLPYYVILGVFCAAASVYFLRVNDRVEAFFAHRKNWAVRYLIGAVALGLLIFLFPPLFGEGYSSLSLLLNGDTAGFFKHSFFESWTNHPWSKLLFLFLLIPLKGIATAITMSSGGVGGTFGPSLVLGGISGYFVATLLGQLGLPTQSVTNFSLVGMAAVMTGVMHAPFMATFLIIAITGGYGLLVPLLVTVVVTYLCVNPFEKHSIYGRKLALQGNLMTHDKDSAALQFMDLTKIIETNFVIVRHNDKLRDLVEAIKNSKRNIFPVLTDDDKFLGVIVMDDVRKIMFRNDLYDKYTVDELMHPLTEGDVVRISDPPSEIVSKFIIGNRYNIIAIDDHNNYLGFISRANMLSEYKKFVCEFSEE